MRRVIVVITCLSLLTLSLTLAEDRADLAAIYKIKDEGLNRSQIMELLSYLTDVYGPRLPGDANTRKAAEWVQSKFREWGLENVHAEKYDFGRSWTLDKFSAHMLEPTYSPLIAYPKSWTPGTNGAVQAEAVQVNISSEADLEKYRSKLKGVFVLTQPPRDVEAQFDPQATRYTEDSLAKVVESPDPGRGGRFAQMARMRQGAPSRQLQRKMSELFLSEGVAAVIEPGPGSGGTVFVGRGGERGKDAPPVPAQVVMAAEHYNRICRILDKKLKVKLEVDIRARFLTDDPTDINLIAEIPGTDKKDELVMLGGHFDTLHTGTGATDNAAGCAVSMEAARIIKASGLRPRRTIRVALWGAEELGFLGSRAYVKKHFATRPDPPEGLERMSDEYRQWMEKSRQTPPDLKPDWSRLSAYYNYDNGTGKIRGIYCQGNEEVRPIFEAWLAPFRDMGATAVTMRNTGGTDHLSFDAVGLPGFQFIQDEIEYDTRTHHSNMDVYDRIQRGDMMQSAIVMASFVYHTAMREEKLPRKPLPQPKPGQPTTSAR